MSSGKVGKVSVLIAKNLMPQLKPKSLALPTE